MCHLPSPLGFLSLNWVSNSGALLFHCYSMTLPLPSPQLEREREREEKNYLGNEDFDYLIGRVPALLVLLLLLLQQWEQGVQCSTTALHYFQNSSYFTTVWDYSVGLHVATSGIQPRRRRRRRRTTSATSSLTTSSATSPTTTTGCPKKNVP